MNEPVSDEPGFEPAPRERPQLDELGFDARLMTPARLLELAGQHPMRLTQQLDGVDATLDCVICGQAITKLTDTIGEPYRFTALQLLQDVLRHRVMAHDVPLSGKKE